jgi:hypothetical protein
MAFRSPTQKLADLRNVLARLEQNRHNYDLVSFAQLKRILHRRMNTLAAETRDKNSERPVRRAA